MGKIFPGFPPALGKFLINEFKATNFVETGTYLGYSAVWASKIFNNVYTIERSKKLYKSTKRKNKGIKNIHFINGDSANELKNLRKKIVGRIVFWLDAHWSGGLTYGKRNECPLLKEILTIRDYKQEYVIVIDDADFFLSSPPPPHKLSDWPTLKDISSKFDDKDHYLVIWKDVVIIVPYTFHKKIDEFIASDNKIFNRVIFFFRKRMFNI